jgi:cation diffusion facilitator family transporter
LDRASEVRKVLLITLFLNLLVSGAKIVYGYYSGSVAIVSDGYHSLFDGVSNVMGLVAVRIASNPPDSRHPYGHRKYETVFTIFIGVLMLLTCFEIFKDVYRSMSGSKAANIDAASFALMAGTMAVNIFVAFYERARGRALDSEFLIADASHTMSDIYVTVGVIISLIFVKLGFPTADPVAGIVVGLFVARAGITIIMESTETLVDKTQVDEALLMDTAGKIKGVLECHSIRTRGTRSNVFVDLHVLGDPSLSIGEAHGIAHEVEDNIKRSVPEIVDVVVHVEPFCEKGTD